MSRPYEVGFMCFGNKKIIFFYPLALAEMATRDWSEKI